MIAVVLGVLLNHERFQSATLVGMGLIVTGWVCMWGKVGVRHAGCQRLSNNARSRVCY
jgi:drug/metabolite transporter (DMT)-like permease